MGYITRDIEINFKYPKASMTCVYHTLHRRTCELFEVLVGVLIKRKSFFLFVQETCVQYLIVLFTANIIYFILKSDCLVGNVSHFLWNINYRVQITNNRSTFPMGFMGV